MPNPLAIGVTLGGLLLDVVAPRPKPRAGLPPESSLLSACCPEDTAVRGSRCRERRPRGSARRPRVGRASRLIARCVTATAPHRARLDALALLPVAWPYVRGQVPRLQGLPGRRDARPPGAARRRPPEVPEAEAELHVINTCCITSEAEAKSRQSARRSLQTAERGVRRRLRGQPNPASSPRSTRACSRSSAPPTRSRRRWRSGPAACADLEHDVPGAPARQPRRLADARVRQGPGRL